MTEVKLVSVSRNQDRPAATLKLSMHGSSLGVCLGKYLGLCFHVPGSRLGYCVIKTMHPSVVSGLGQTQLGHDSESHDTMKHYVGMFQHSYMTLESK